MSILNENFLENNVLNISLQSLTLNYDDLKKSPSRLDKIMDLSIKKPKGKLTLYKPSFNHHQLTQEDQLKLEIVKLQSKQTKLEWNIERNTKQSLESQQQDAIKRDIDQKFKEEQKLKEMLQEQKKNERVIQNKINKQSIQDLRNHKDNQTNRQKYKEQKDLSEAYKEFKWNEQQKEKQKEERIKKAKERQLEIEFIREQKQKQKFKEQREMNEDINYNKKYSKQTEIQKNELRLKKKQLESKVKEIDPFAD